MFIVYPLLERCVVGLLRLVIRMMSREAMVSEVSRCSVCVCLSGFNVDSLQLLGSLGILLTLPSPTVLLPTHQQITRAISDLIQTQAGAMKTQHDWWTLIYILEGIGTGSNQASGVPTWSPFHSAKVDSSSQTSDTQMDTPTLPAASNSSNAVALFLKENLCKFDVLVEGRYKATQPRHLLSVL